MSAKRVHFDTRQTQKLRRINLVLLKNLGVYVSDEVKVEFVSDVREVVITRNKAEAGLHGRG